MNIQISGLHIELTPAIRDYVDEKISSLEKYYPEIIDVKVDLGQTSKHHNKGEDLFETRVHIHVAGHDFHGHKTSGDLYASVDAVHDELKIEMRRYKEKVRDAERQQRPDKL